MHGNMMKKELTVSSLIEHAARYHADTEVVSVETDGGQLAPPGARWKPTHANWLLRSASWALRRASAAARSHGTMCDISKSISELPVAALFATPSTRVWLPSN